MTAMKGEAVNPREANCNKIYVFLFNSPTQKQKSPEVRDFFIKSKNPKKGNSK